MAWIKTIHFRDADEKLFEYMRRMRQTLPPEYSTPAPKASKTEESIVESHTLIPEAMFHAFMTMSSLMTDDLPLNRRQQEMIATIVSEKNDCHYWVESHAEFLRRVTLDEQMVADLRNDYQTADITEAEKAMCEYAIQLTEDATEISPDNHKKLRSVGFDDTAILQITLIASWFNYINRVADALGIGRENSGIEDFSEIQKD